MAVDPLATLTKLDESVDVRRVRRAMTEDELSRLVDMAERRPLLDAMTVRRGEHKGKAVAKLKDATRARLEQLGRERRLVYMTFYQDERFSEVLHGGQPHEAPPNMTGPLYVLAFLSIVGGWVGIPVFMGGGNHFHHWLAPIILVREREILNEPLFILWTKNAIQNRQCTKARRLS